MSYLTPILYHTLAATLLLSSIYHPPKHPYLILTPSTMLISLALYTTYQIPPTASLNFFFGMLQIVTILNSPFLLSADIKPQEAGSTTKRLILAYKVYNNPRMLPIDPVAPKTPIPLPAFLRTVFLKALSSLALEAGIASLARLILSSCTAADFSSDKERLLSRLVHGQFTMQELPIRLFVSLAWIGMSMSRLNLLHALLSILFVSMLQLDHPDEWPPLFGSLGDAYSLQRFWGKTWHKLATGASVKVARRCVGGTAMFHCLPSVAKKALVSFLVFTISGIAHAVVARCIGEATPMRDAYFFWGCYIGVCLEILVLRALQRITSLIPPIWLKLWRRYIGSSRWLVLSNRVIGYLWVTAFFFWLTPRYMYPKIQSELLK